MQVAHKRNLNNVQPRENHARKKGGADAPPFYLNSNIWPLLAFCRCIAVGNGAPIDHVKKRGNVVWTTVLVIEVVRMFPHV